ncbi:tRNA uracil 4-sulfurtransferase ThiI [Marinobacterium rhizophilum]|uniref:tRNA sulfurtransferase n=1 Tax=Marinobacterium rhizophilum TaxID=420402 RepID=A0ABY5HF49_9GAMM|nr:tRNA uracil 4-sulfurtransferase ThiI [Marinobacterium rhizophilum]UTW10203.1 tRNA 4-thiouridine(8) synthase ThiI [Marinobacterium rhizophilum]
MKFIVKLFPEITIKSRPVRKRMIQRLGTNLEVTLRRVDEQIKVRNNWDKIDVVCAPGTEHLRDEVVSVLSRTPGVHAFLEVREFPLVDFHDAYERTREAYADLLKGKTFKVRVKRTGRNHDFTSVDMERYIGGGLNQHTEAAGVDVRNPEVWVELEVVDERLFIVTERHAGLGGFPLGTQEPVLSLISGGFDSVVASYMTMRRGCKTHFIFFNLGGHAHEIGVKQVALHLWQRYGSSARVKFVTVPFEEVIGELLQNVHHSYMGVILKRMMLRAAERAADFMKIDALVTGESVAQVSSQTLTNLALIDKATDKLVLRPLVTSDKQDIIDLSKQIGAFEFAKSMPEYCGVISDRPTTRGKLERVLEEEDNFDFEVLEQALRKVQVIAIDEIVENVNAHATVEALTRVGDNQVIVDIRAAHEQEKKPLNMPGCEILTIPFFKLGTEVENFDSAREYLLYCEKGVMSQMQAHHLQEKGFGNVKVFRPEGT